MDSFDENIHCEHHRIPRNCYLCYLHRNDNTEGKTILDTIHETLSQLKIRIAKLEEYKRLQDDYNKAASKILHELTEHRKKQIDENRAVSKHLDDLQEGIFKVEKNLTLRVCELERLIESNKYVPFVEADYKDEIIAKHIDGSTTVRMAHSGSIPKTTGLSFEEAITVFKAGKSIRRSSWPKVDYVISRENFDSEANSYNDDDSLIGIDEILAMDWEIVK